MLHSPYTGTCQGKELSLTALVAFPLNVFFIGEGRIQVAPFVSAIPFPAKPASRFAASLAAFAIRTFFLHRFGVPMPNYRGSSAAIFLASARHASIP